MDSPNLPIAKPGTIYMCRACGKKSRDPYGNSESDKGWDVSCFMNCVLINEPPKEDTNAQD